MFLLIVIIIFYIDVYSSDKLSYRLGDCVTFEAYRVDKKNKFIYKNFYKNSIGFQYLNRSTKINDHELLYDIIKNMKSQKPEENTIVIHVRSGDVIDDRSKGNIEDLLYPKDEKVHNYVKPLNYYIDNLKKIKIKKLLIITGFHMKGKKHKSIKYIERLKEEFSKLGYEIDTKIAQNSPDQDFLFMSNSKYFLKSGGNFSNLINEMVKRNKGVCLSD